MEPDYKKVICTNKKAYYNYNIEQTYEAGLVLKGTEVKSLRLGKVSLSDSYAEIKDNQLYLINCHISHYPFATHDQHEPLRPKKLLLHKREIKRLIGKLKQRGLTLIPLRIYFYKGKAKVELGLAKGKRKIDKREEIKKRDEERLMEKRYKIK
ncbi:SmpB protein [Candidatus Desulfofervidus auxilii]|uniref:SsrA-binding protein n=1 Tax=Desulfofervidus auxilii TaxID=1621989 RepID=A0A7C1ZND1_DESA2|nr:SsrA-binding protein SmpB [Candidatus Desulfofervidus auxilii]CAD7773095.1 MAG: SsrA-binding protein [Candidatus Methanoperedenaceae archaeon GB50]CAD7777902.1 SsrA-binding protein [Candidatus Methanoperedenaceae archaeon GB37]AMM41109.1 SmpB protein [Candidatus Desulfofervidus auxilii]CAD7776680.1 SsrA-binding protein [Candidatus Methanoperedenaceae archaeon GB50]CAD7783612.1 MAG: SsrA-binding protein [Candidatus Methanoperedenaceae archaeon GB37]